MPLLDPKTLANIWDWVEQSREKDMMFGPNATQPFQFFPSGITKIKDAVFHSRFDEAIADYLKSGDAGWKSRSTLVRMSPQEFLDMAEYLPNPDPDKMARVLQMLKEGKPFSLPELDFYACREGLATVLGHEGRHRAIAMKNLGWKDFPVKFTSQGSPSIRWGSMPKDFKWPSLLEGQEDNFLHKMKFPKSLLDY